MGPIGQVEATLCWKLLHHCLQFGLLHSVDRGGKTTRLLEGHRPRTALAEDGNPPANGMGIPSQRLGHRHRSPALDQKPSGMPPFPLPGCRRPVHSPPQITSIQLPLFQKPRHLSHTQHQHHSASSFQTIPSAPQFYLIPMEVSPWLRFRIGQSRNKRCPAQEFARCFRGCPPSATSPHSSPC